MEWKKKKKIIFTFSPSAGKAANLWREMEACVSEVK